MARRALSGLVAAATLSGFALPASGQGMIAGAASPARPSEKIYASTCGHCHGHNVGPVIRGRQLPPALVLALVRRGQGAMPAFRQTEISDQELKALAQWIQASKADPKEHGQ